MKNKNMDFRSLVNNIMGLATISETETTITARYAVPQPCLVSEIKQITLPNRGWDVPKFHTLHGWVGVTQLTDEECQSIMDAAGNIDFANAKYDESGRPYYFTQRKTREGAPEPRGERAPRINAPSAKWVEKYATEEQRKQWEELRGKWECELAQLREKQNAERDEFLNAHKDEWLTKAAKMELEERIAALSTTEPNPLPSWVNEDNFGLIPESINFSVNPIGMSAIAVALVRKFPKRINIAW